MLLEHNKTGVGAGEGAEWGSFKGGFPLLHPEGLEVSVSRLERGEGTVASCCPQDQSKPLSMTPRPFATWLLRISRIQASPPDPLAKLTYASALIILWPLLH